MFIATVSVTLLTGQIKHLSECFNSERECNIWIKRKLSHFLRQDYAAVSACYTVF